MRARAVTARVLRPVHFPCSDYPRYTSLDAGDTGDDLAAVGIVIVVDSLAPSNIIADVCAGRKGSIPRGNRKRAFAREHSAAIDRVDLVPPIVAVWS